MKKTGNFKKNKRRNKVLAVLLLFSLLLTMLCGCGNNNAETENSGQKGGSSDNSESTQAAENETGNVAMGRYLEDVTDLSDSGISGYNNEIFMLADGNLVITDEYTDFLISKDNGITWETDIRSWRTEMLENEVYIMDFAIGTDGTVAVIYDAQEDSDSLNPVLMLIKPDGTEIPVELSVTEDDMYPKGVAFTDRKSVV